MKSPRVGNTPFLLNTPHRPLAGFPLAFSHRGFAPAGEENTVKAFTAATELGFGYLETDVHATRDGVLVAFHDEDLVRLTGDPRRVRDCTAAELAELRVAGEPIPTFDELLESFRSARFNVDIKAGPAAELMAETLIRHRAEDRVLVASFSSSRRRKVSRLLAAGHPPHQLATSPGIIGVGAAVLIGAVAPLPRAVYRSVAALQVPETHGKIRVVTPRFIQRAHDASLQVHVWVVNDAPAMRRLLDMGVDGIMTDAAPTLAAVMSERGHWPQNSLTR